MYIIGSTTLRNNLFLEYERSLCTTSTKDVITYMWFFFFFGVSNAQPSCHSLENRAIDRHHTTHRAITPLSRLFHSPGIKASHLEKPASLSGASLISTTLSFISQKAAGFVTAPGNSGLRSAWLFISCTSQTGNNAPISDQKLED